MIVFRLCKSSYAKDLSGIGAQKSGGRWNGKGFAMLYTSGSRALCLTEIAVHVPLGIIPMDFVLVAIEIPESAEIVEIKADNLPENWRDFPHRKATNEIGNDFLSDSKYLILKVPSAVVQGEFNYLVNPHHELFNHIKILKIEPFYFDERLFR